MDFDMGRSKTFRRCGRLEAVDSIHVVEMRGEGEVGGCDGVLKELSEYQKLVNEAGMSQSYTRLLFHRTDSMTSDHILSYSEAAAIGETTGRHQWIEIDLTALQLVELVSIFSQNSVPSCA